MLLWTILIAVILALILALARPGVWFEQLEYFALTSYFNLWVALSAAALLCRLCNAKPKWLANNTLLSISTFLIVQLITLLYTVIGIYYQDQLSLHLPSTVSVSERILRNLAISGLVTLIALRHFYLRHQHLLTAKSSLSLQLNALQMRIRPHFLFNSMNAVSSLISTQPALAEQMIADMCDLFRASLQPPDQPHRLQDEMALIEGYLRIEALRLGPKLQVDWQIANPLPNIVLPALSVQPLVENAVYHGISALPDGGTLTIEVDRKKGKYCQIRISNPMPSTKKPSDTQGNHIALANIHQRLVLAFENRASINTSKGYNSYCVTLRLPLTGSRNI